MTIKERAFQLIMAHLQLLENYESLSNYIVNLSPDDNLDEIVSQVDNRDRLLKAITQLQNSIESYILENVQEHDTELFDVLKSWDMDIKHVSHKIDQINQAILEMLNKKREETVTEIGSIHKSKEKFKGYNLNNTKR